MPFIGQEPITGAFRLLDAIDLTGITSKANFDLELDGTPFVASSARNLIVSLNGVTQAPETAFTVSGSTLTFTSNITSSDVIDYILVLGDVGTLPALAQNSVSEYELSYPLPNFSSTGIDDNATSTAITIDSSQNVGIGTNSPAEILHIVDTSTGGAVGLRAENSEGHVNFTTNGGGFQFETGASGNVATIDASGNVGIGRTDPRTVLEVSGSTNRPLTVNSSSSTSVVTFTDSATTSIGHVKVGSEGDELLLYAGANERMRIDSSGTVKVGGTGSGFLQLLGASSGLEGGQIDLITAGSLGTYSIDAYSDNLRFLNTTTAGNYLFYKNSNAAIGVTVTGTGRIGIGTTGPSFPLDIRAPSDGGDAVLRAHNQFTGSSDDAILRLSIAGTTGDSIIQFGDGDDNDVGKIAYHHNGNTMRFFTGGDEEMRLEDDGDLHVENSVIGSSSTVSDERFKDDVTTITGALDTVDSLRGVTFTWNTGKNTGQTDYGFVAQEVEQVIPEIVQDKKLPLFASDEDTLYKTVDYAKVCAVLVEAVSELRAEVRSLETRLSALEAN